MATRGRVLIISADKTLIGEMTPSLAGREYEVLTSSGVREAALRLGTEQFAAVVFDQAKVTPQEREALLGIHSKQPTYALFLVENQASLSPVESLPLRRLNWPLPAGFVDQVRAVDRPIVFLCDQTLFATNALGMHLTQSGIQPIRMESTKGMIDFVRQQCEAMTPKPKSLKPKSLWERLGASGDTDVQEPVVLGKILIVQFPGRVQEAEALDGLLRQTVSMAICYYVSGADPVRAAAKAVKESFPASLMREQAGRVAGILAGATDEPGKKDGPKEKDRILLLDNYQPTLATLGQALMAAGYEVTTSMDGAEALKLAGKKGTFHLSIIGTAIAMAQQSGAELAQKLREFDPDLRIIFMVDRYPLQAALQGVSQVVELGLDDALLKPVEASRLIFSVQRAMERRHLLLENARLLKEVQTSNQQLEQINGFQKKFFAMVAHDVKNPLTAILGYAEVLGMRLKDQPGELKCAGHIHSAARTLNALISDLVDLAAIESGKLRVEIGALDLAAVANEVRSRIDVVAQQRKIALSLEMPPVLPALSGDPHRIGQVIQNLCTNAIQYTKEGGSVTVRIDVTPDWVTVGVRDTGIGISKEDLPRVFERFFQTQEAQAMRKAGFGLGLKIAREIVQMHGGEIGLDSQLGVGSLFYFTLPVKK